MSPTFTPAQLQDELSRRSGLPVRLFLTGNRRRMVSARRVAGAVEVRLQRIFLGAGEEVLAELALLLQGGKTERRALRKFVDEQFAAASATQDEQPQVRTRRMPGRESSCFAHHDIEACARHLNETYLGGRSSARIVWGKRSTRRSRRSIRFACYDPERNLVIMNRKLDTGSIPAYFVEYILFHEMLHEVLGIGERGDGRRDIHGSLFKLMESTFPDYDKARRFEKELCRRLGTL